MKKNRFDLQLGIVLGTVVTALMLLTGPSLLAQLQQSGGPGSTVTIGAALPAGAAVIGKVTIDQTTPGTTNLVQVGGSLPAGSAVIGKMTIDQTTPGTTNLVQVGGTLPAYAATPTFNVGTMGALVAGSATIGAVIPKTPCGTTVANQALIAVPTSPTSVFAATTCIMGAYFNNTNASAQTVTLTDAAGTPLNGIGPAFSVPGLSNMFLPYNGIQFTSGVKWTAGGTGVTGAVWGFQ